jgi:hypothetical protein
MAFVRQRPAVAFGDPSLHFVAEPDELVGAIADHLHPIAGREVTQGREKPAAAP